MQRESFEAQQMDVVTSAFNAELTSAKERISEAVGHAMKAFDSPRLGLVKSSSLSVSFSSRMAWHFFAYGSVWGEFRLCKVRKVYRSSPLAKTVPINSV